MRITFFTPASEGTGGFIRCFYLGKFLAKRGHEISLVCPGKELSLHVSQKNIAGVTLITLPRSANLVKIIPLEFVNSIINCYLEIISRSDLIHLFSVVNPMSAGPTLLARILKSLKLQKKKVLVDWEDWWGRGGIFQSLGKIIEVPGTIIEEKVPLFADSVTVVSEVLKKRALRVGIQAGKVFKIPNGSDVDFIKPIPKLIAREKLGLPIDKLILCHVGVADLSQVYARISKRYSDAILLVLGSFSRYAKVQTPKLDGIIYVGRQPSDKIPFYLGASDVLLLRQDDVASDWGRWPIRFGDYLAAGRPTVTPDIGEVAQIIRESNCGLLAKPNDWEDFADRIIELAENPHLCEQLGRNARGVAEKDYSWQIIASKLEEVYRYVCDRH